MRAGIRREHFTFFRAVLVLFLLGLRHASGAGLLFVADGGNTVGDYNAGTGAPINVSLIAGLSSPVGLALSGTSLYVLNGGNSTVSLYNAATGVPTATFAIAGTDAPAGFAVSGGRMYVANQGDGTVGEYSSITGIEINPAFITGLGAPSAIAVSGGALYVTGSDGAIGKYIASTGAALNTSFITGLSDPSAIAISNDILYVACGGNGVVGEYSATTGAVLNASLITGLDHPTALAVHGSALYVASGTGAVAKYIATTGVELNGAFIPGLPNVTSLALAPFPPVITSAPIVTGTVDYDLNYQITAKNNPTSFNARRLPPGLKVIRSTGLVSGRPVIAGTFASLIQAINLGGTGSAPLAIVVDPLPPPVITSSLKVTGTAGFPFNYRIRARNFPGSFGAASLPAGLAVDTASGLISGIPGATGSFAATISAINSSGTGSATLSLVLKEPPPPVITSRTEVSAIAGISFDYRIKAKNFPASFAAAGLPSGLSVNESTGLISGTPEQTGTFRSPISAVNLGGTGSATLALTVRFDFAKSRGVYNGLCYSDGVAAGLFTLSLTPSGAFTGSLAIAKKRFPLQGMFSDNGTFVRTTGLGNVTLDLDFSINQAAPEIDGDIVLTSTAGIEGFLAQSSLLAEFSRKTLPAGIAGRYTVMMPPLSGTDPALPHAPGYATMTVSPKGAVRVAGKLGDGTPFIAGGRLNADAKSWTVFLPISHHGEVGSAAGAMTFETLPDSDGDGTLELIETGTAGYSSSSFPAELSILAAKYTSPALAPGTATLSLTGGTLPNPGISDTLTISPDQHAIASGAGEATLSLSPGTGRFTGKFLHPVTGTEISFGGVIYQKPTSSGFGLFMGQGEAGSVEISQ